jgi:NitT/TauT family transport system permease protein
MGWAWTYLVVAELVAANSGLGFAILKAQRFLQTDKIFAGIMLIGLIGLVIDQLFRLLHRKAFPWLHLKRRHEHQVHPTSNARRLQALRTRPSPSRR